MEQNVKPHEIGDRYGMLVVVELWKEQRNKGKSKETRCKCLCDCGNTIETWGCRLREPLTKKHCGCIKRAHNKEHPGWKGCGELSSTRWSSIKGHSKRFGRVIEFSITIEYAWDLFLKQDRKCALTGLEIAFPDYHRDAVDLDNCASLDRIDSNKGYIEDNIQWVHKKINIMKMDFDQDKFIEWCKIITRNQKENI
jgi:hypothetical protein